jgi:hypothetical protein
MKNLAEFAREFFTGVRIEKRVIDNPFIENGPLISEEKYYSSNGNQFGSGYGVATPREIRKLYPREV